MVEQNRIEVEKFKSLIKEMFRGYPNYFYYGMVEKVINKATIKDLLEDSILILGKYCDNKGNSKEGYTLGSNALPLVSAWKNEELTKNIYLLTKVMYFLTGLLVILTVFMLIRMW